MRVLITGGQGFLGGWLQAALCQGGHSVCVPSSSELDVRDAMRAYWEAIVYCKPGEVYNIGGETSMTVGEVLERLVSLSDSKIPTQQDSTLLRPVDVTLQIPDTEKFRETTGWAPKYSIDQSLRFLIDHWREMAKRVKYDMALS